MPRNVLKCLLLLISVAMIGLTIVTSMRSDLFAAWPRLSSEPWMVATLIDFYLNILLFSLWVFYKERKRLTALFWVISFVALGSISTAFYIFIQIAKLRSDEPIQNAFLRRE